MATFSNRSPYTVSIPRRPQFTRSFPSNQAKKAEAYAKSLKAQGLLPTVTQDDSSWQVRVRRTGHKDQNITFGSLLEAEGFVQQVEAKQHQGLFTDYTTAANTTMAMLIARYIEEDCPGLKGRATYIITLNAMVEDSTHELRKRIALRKQEIKEFGKARTPLGANRQPMTSLEWLHLPLTELGPKHIEDFIRDRLDYVAGATVDRQIDLLSAIMNRAMNGWRINLERSPFDGVKRPRYFNERDRRLKGDEEVRLLNAARIEDQLMSLEAYVQAEAADEVRYAKTLATHYAKNEASKAAYDKARRKALAEGFPHVPMMEAFTLFQIGTAARRGEALGLFWNQIDWEMKTAALPTTKNGRPRKLAVRTDILTLLKLLPQSGDTLFDISIKVLVSAWGRICEAASIDDLHIHDLRHEGISRAAESGLFITVLDLQAYSGHRDTRSLSRYTHLCAGAIARLLDVAEEKRLVKLGNKGRERRSSSDLLWLGGVAPATSATTPPEDVPAAEPAPDVLSTPVNVFTFRPRLVS